MPMYNLIEHKPAVNNNSVIVAFNAANVTDWFV